MGTSIPPMGMPLCQVNIIQGAELYTAATASAGLCAVKRLRPNHKLVEYSIDQPALQAVQTGYPLLRKGLSLCNPNRSLVQGRQCFPQNGLGFRFFRRGEESNIVLRHNHLQHPLIGKSLSPAKGLDALGCVSNISPTGHDKVYHLTAGKLRRLEELHQHMGQLPSVGRGHNHPGTVSAKFTLSPLLDPESYILRLVSQCLGQKLCRVPAVSCS